MISYSICLIDDDEDIRIGVGMALDTFYRVESFETAEDALAVMEKSLPDLVLLDIGLPGMNGIEALRRIKALCPRTLVIMITAYDDIETVISAMKLGAHDYVVKPLHMDGLEVCIRNALETIRLRKEVQLLQEKYLKESTPCFIGLSRNIQDVMDTVDMVAQSPDTPVLIVGETGTGKELVASAIHYRSPNFNGRLVSINCSAIPRDLIESELFGYEPGAFTGARTAGKRGLIEEAANGTLFLDEIGDLSLEAQGKLLRFLEGGEYYKIGGTKKYKGRARIISATNKSLESMIREGTFREDLYYRIGVIKIEVPSLNERREDIIPLARHFLVEYSRKLGKSFTGIASEAEDALKCYHWQGNIRELKNFIERGVILGKGSELTLRDLGIRKSEERESQGRGNGVGEFPPLSPEGIDLSSLQESLERYYIKEALKLAGGNESKAALLLNVNHHTFRYRKKKLLDQ